MTSTSRGVQFSYISTKINFPSSSSNRNVILNPEFAPLLIPSQRNFLIINAGTVT